MNLYLIESNYKTSDCFESVVVTANNPQEASQVALEYINRETNKWHLEDNFNEDGYTVTLIDISIPKVIHSSFWDG